MIDLERLIAEAVERELDRRGIVRAPDEYLSTSQAADLAAVAEGTIRRWIREGRLADHRAGRCVRVLRSDLDKLLRSGGRHANDITPEEQARRDFG